LDTTCVLSPFLFPASPAWMLSELPGTVLW
jgi:hypothetical protein